MLSPRWHVSCAGLGGLDVLLQEHFGLGAPSRALAQAA